MSIISDAIRCLEHRDLHSAKILFQKAIAENGPSSSAHAGLANCYALEGNLTLAQHELEEALKYGELDTLGHLAHGYIYHNDVKAIEAENHFIQAIKMDSNSAFAHLVYGSFLLMHENNQDAIQVLLQAKKLGGNHWWVNSNLAIAYLRTGKTYNAFIEAMLSMFSRPSKAGLNLVFAASFRAIIFLLIVVFVIGTLFFIQQPLGMILLVTAALILELVNYSRDKNRQRLIVIVFSVFILGLLIFLNYLQ